MPFAKETHPTLSGASRRELLEELFRQRESNFYIDFQASNGRKGHQAVRVLEMPFFKEEVPSRKIHVDCV